MTIRNAYMTGWFSVPASAGPLLPLMDSQMVRICYLFSIISNIGRANSTGRGIADSIGIMALLLDMWKSKIV